MDVTSLTPEAKSDSSGHSLTRRAYLTMWAGLARQGVRAIVALVTAPVIANGLGREMYGALLVIRQASGLLGFVDLRAGGTVKFAFAVNQDEIDANVKRRRIGAALALWRRTLPLFALVAVIGSLMLPYALEVASSHVAEIQVAFCITIAGLALGTVINLPANVLRGLNLDYRWVGLDLVSLCVGGALPAAAIAMNLGLVGVVTGGLIGSLLTASGRFFVAKRALPWFGAERPLDEERRTFRRLTGWLLLGNVGDLLVDASALVLVGIAASPSIAAVYGSTEAISRLARGPVAELIGSSGSGLALLCSRRDWVKINNVRLTLQQLALGIGTIVAGTILVVNQPFIRLWLGQDYFGGERLTTFLALVFVFVTFSQVDSMMIDSLMGYRHRALLTAVGACMAIIGGLSSISALGPVGVAAAVLGARLVMTVGLLVLVGQRCGSLWTHAMHLVRPILVSALLIGVARVYASTLQSVISNWPQLVLVTGAVPIVIGASWMMLALPASTRTTQRARLLNQLRPRNGVR